MFLLALSLVGCTAGTVTLDNGAGSDGAEPNDLNGNGIPDDEEEEEEEDPVHFAAGSWQGVMGLVMVEWDYDICEGEFELTVDEVGEFEGTANCIAESNWGTQEFPGEFSGSIDEDGEVSGTAVFEVRFGGGGGGEQTVDADIEGSADETDMELFWLAEVEWGGGGGGGAEIEGWGEAELD